MKTFTQWLRSFKVKEQPKRIVDPRIFQSFADNYKFTNDHDLNGMWLTKIHNHGK